MQADEKHFGSLDKTRVLQVLWKVEIGLAIGLIGALYLSDFMTSLLFEVKSTDPPAYV